jgi:hypothetical protein
MNMVVHDRVFETDEQGFCFMPRTGAKSTPNGERDGVRLYDELGADRLLPRYYQQCSTHQACASSC